MNYRLLFPFRIETSVTDNGYVELQTKKKSMIGEAIICNYSELCSSVDLLFCFSIVLIC